jgi:hypothetical protein
MADEHQVNTIIATAIREYSNRPLERERSPEEAKQMAKCIIEALAVAGLEIRLRERS